MNEKTNRILTELCWRSSKHSSWTIQVRCVFQARQIKKRPMTLYSCTVPHGIILTTWFSSIQHQTQQNLIAICFT